MAEYDIRSVWVKRPDIKGRLSWEFSGIHVDSCLYLDGSVKWAIRSGEDAVMSKYDGYFYLERLPSDRSDEYYEEFRFNSIDEAVEFARTANPGREHRGRRKKGRVAQR